MLTGTHGIHSVKLINAVAEWGYPLGECDIKDIVKTILDKKGARSIFMNSTPGETWMRGFAKRHKLSTRLASNIKRSRASVNRDTINSFFDSFEKHGQNVPPQNVFNFDEINLTDNPKKKRVFVARGTRRVENVTDHSKASVSLTWCWSATGETPPPPWLCIKQKQPTKDGAAGDLLAPFMMLQKVGGSKAELFAMVPRMFFDCCQKASRNKSSYRRQSLVPFYATGSYFCSTKQYLLHKPSHQFF